jgi:hypothetical protein
MDKVIYTFIFQGEIEKLYIEAEKDTKISELIRKYFQ